MTSRPMSPSEQATRPSVRVEADARVEGLAEALFYHDHPGFMPGAWAFVEAEVQESYRARADCVLRWMQDNPAPEPPHGRLADYARNVMHFMVDALDGKNTPRLVDTQLDSLRTRVIALVRERDEAQTLHEQAERHVTALIEEKSEAIARLNQLRAAIAPPPNIESDYQTAALEEIRRLRAVDKQESPNVERLSLISQCLRLGERYDHINVIAEIQRLRAADKDKVDRIAWMKELGEAKQRAISSDCEAIVRGNLLETLKGAVRTYRDARRAEIDSRDSDGYPDFGRASDRKNARKQLFRCVKEPRP